MLELFGVGIPRRTGGWFVRDVSARIDSPAVVALTGGSGEQREALLDAIAGRLVPTEGRVWLGGVPIISGRRSLVRRLVADLDPRSTAGNAVRERCPTLASRAWTALLGGRRHGAADRARDVLESTNLARRVNDPSWRLTPAERLVVDVARSHASGVECVVVRELDAILTPAEAAATVALLKLVADSARLVIVVSARDGSWARRTASRVIDISTPSPARLSAS